MENNRSLNRDILLVFQLAEAGFEGGEHSGLLLDQCLLLLNLRLQGFYCCLLLLDSLYQWDDEGGVAQTVEIVFVSRCVYSAEIVAQGLSSGLHFLCYKTAVADVFFVGVEVAVFGAKKQLSTMLN